MQMKIIGLADVKFKNVVGEIIQGTTLYTAYQSKQVKEGMKTDKVFIPTEIELPELKAGDQVEMFFNNRGRAEYVEKI